MKYQHRVLGMLSLLAVITFLDRVCIAVAGPAIQRDLHIDPAAWGWVTGIFSLSYAAFEVPTGTLGDRIGARKVLTRVVIWWSAFTSLTGLVTNYPMLLFTRFWFGAGEAGAYPNVAVVLRRWIPAPRRGGAWGIVWMMSQIGGAISPLLVVPIQARYGWRASFWLFGAAGVLWSAAWYRWFRDQPADKAGITQAELAELGDGEPPKHHALPWSVALRSRTLWHIMAVPACYGYGMQFFQAWLPTYLSRGKGYADGALVWAGIPFAVGAATNLLGGLLSDRLVRAFGLRTGRRIIGATGLGTAACCLAGAAVATNNTALLALLSLAYGGMTFQQANYTAVCIDTGGRHTGAVLGFGNTASNAAGLLSSVMFGYIVEWTGSYQAPMIPMIGALLAGALVWLKLDATREAVPATPA
jgi:ACS family glucarate transporter-like MFS transporter